MEDFLEDIKNDHRDFDYGKLDGFFGKHPFELFTKWYEEAFQSNQPEFNAFTLGTVDAEGQPSSRILYLKELLDEKFIFYTNYNSHKGQDIEVNPKVSMLFFWPGLQRQLRIEGVVQKVDEKISDAYFASRPRGSQIGAWASNQSEWLEDRHQLEHAVIAFAEKFTDEVPRPPHWGGYELTPTLVEFWQGRPSRLHDRIVYFFENEQWHVQRKNP